MKRKVIAPLLLLCALATQADDSIMRPLNATYSLELGNRRITDTYLSPIRHTGLGTRISGQWRQAMKHNPQKQITGIQASIAYATTHNPQHNSTMTDIGATLQWDMQWRFRPMPSLQAEIGPGIALDAGATYLPRNSNNPVSARLSLDATLAAGAHYTLTLGPAHIRINDTFTLPCIGIFFSPQFGQSYYEIYLGDRQGLLHPGWWGNHFLLDNLLAADLRLGSTWLRIGYRINILSSKVNDITTRLTTHSALIGISTDWLNVTSSSANNSLIPSIY